MNIMVADDTKNIRMLLTKCLELEGHTVTTANDGQSALDLLKCQKFDLAFIDIKMPQISGTEVLKTIRDMGIDIPVIIITAYATIKNAVECTQMGAVAYLQKPFTAEKVRLTLKELMSTKPVETDNFDNELRKIEDAIYLKNFDNAEKLLKKALSVEPGNLQIYRLLGLVYRSKGELEKATKFEAIYNLLKEET